MVLKRYELALKRSNLIVLVRRPMPPLRWRVGINWPFWSVVALCLALWAALYLWLVRG